MSRPKIDDDKKRVKSGFTISQKLLERLESYVAEKMVIKARVIERAIEEYLEHHK